MKTSSGVLPAPAPRPGGGGVDAGGAHFERGEAVGHAHGEVVVAVEAELGLGLQRIAHRGQARLDGVGQQVAGRVGDVDAVGAVALHQLGLGDQAFGAVHVRHHQEADGVHAELAGHADVLLGDVGLGAVGGDADRATRRARAPSSGGRRCRCPAAAAPRPWPASSAGSRCRGIPRRCARGSRSSTEAPPRPSPWVTSISGTPAASSPVAMVFICSSVIRWRLGCMPSRRVMSWTVIFLPRSSMVHSPWALRPPWRRGWIRASAGRRGSPRRTSRRCAHRPRS